MKAAELDSTWKVYSCTSARKDGDMTYSFAALLVLGLAPRSVSQSLVMGVGTDILAPAAAVKSARTW